MSAARAAFFYTIFTSRSPVQCFVKVYTVLPSDACKCLPEDTVTELSSATTDSVSSITSKAVYFHCPAYQVDKLVPVLLSGNGASA